MQTVIDALVGLPGVHLAVVCVPSPHTPRVRVLQEQAVRAGVADRVHLLDPVAPSQVAAFLAGADVGVAPFRHFGSHEFALPNKLFEYLQAGLPLVVSDCRAVARFVQENQVGAVFTADDAVSCAAALREVFERRGALRRRIVEDDALLAPYAWETQAANLRGLYRELLGDDAAVREPGSETPIRAFRETPVWRAPMSPTVLAVGPANMAGQAWEWAKAAQRCLPGVDTQVVTVDRGPALTFPTDIRVAVDTHRTDASWAERLEREDVTRWTHALIESGRPILGGARGRGFEDEAHFLRAQGIRVGLVMHGSEIRDPARNAQATRWSPFHDPNDGLTAQLQRQASALSSRVEAFMNQEMGPVFVSTPDLLSDVPGAHWLPVVVDTQRWHPGPPVLAREKPVVVHVPSKRRLKGSAAIDEILGRMHEHGLVEYRPLSGVRFEDMPDVIRTADTVVDQFSLGIYGVLPCEAMSAERVVISHVLPESRDRAQTAAGLELPVIEADPQSLEGVVHGLLADRDSARRRAAAGREFVETLHDGRRSAQVLQQHLALNAAPSLAVQAAESATRAQLEAAVQAVTAVETARDAAEPQGA